MSNFIDVLNDMRTHYKNNISNGLAIPYYPDLVEDALNLEEASSKFFITSDKNDSDSENAIVHEKLNDLQNKAKSISVDTASTIEDELKKVSKNSAGSNSAFRDELNRIREDAKKKAADNIDKIFDEAQKIGETFPKTKNLILVTAQKINQLINDLISKLVDYIVKIVENVVLWLKTAWDSITSTFNGIKNWILHWF
ncbi:hypothetical protein [Acinetobacter beijerinckii]|uniref:hypothetical protein n=1 Tax=Acinetobacter beijerinckii TaxID=262668 RepID=UPI003AF79598